MCACRPAWLVGAAPTGSQGAAAALRPLQHAASIWKDPHVETISVADMDAAFEAAAAEHGWDAVPGDEAAPPAKGRRTLDFNAASEALLLGGTRKASK